MVALVLLIILSSAHARTCNEASTVSAGCDTCDINDVLTDLGGDKIVPNLVFPKDPVDGCSVTELRCVDERWSECDSVTAYGVTATSTEMIGLSFVTSARVNLTCGKDGTWSFNSQLMGIQTVYCTYLNCS